MGPKSANQPSIGLPYSASGGASRIPQYDMVLPDEPSDAQHCAQMIDDYHVLDFNPRLNTSSYVNVTLEPEEERIALMGLKVNLADQTVYTESFKLHNDVLNMIAKLWNCPKPEDFESHFCYPGAGCVGSTEACLLGGLALKFRWRDWYRRRHGLSAEQVRGIIPNLVISTMFQACWEKLFKYMDIEPRFVVPSCETFTLDASKIKDVVDDKTMGVICILGNHYCGQYDPVWDVDAALSVINRENDFQLGIHVDAASGGFVAPFQDDLPAWDFRLKNVLSISASGHKFGNSCCGTGWIVWRHREGLSETVATNVSYLGGSADSYTLNFSRPAQGIYVQFYKLFRLGRRGYRAQVDNQMATAAYIRQGLASMERDGKPLFKILDAVGQSAQKVCLPVVAAMFNPELNLSCDEINLQDAIAQSHWYVSGYKMSAHHPLTGETMPLFSDQSTEQAMFRIVVKNNLTMSLATHLLREIAKAVRFLELHQIRRADDLDAPGQADMAMGTPAEKEVLRGAMGAAEDVNNKNASCWRCGLGAGTENFYSS